MTNNSNTEKNGIKPRPNVALLATCLVDLYRPSVGFASIKLLRAAGCQVTIPTTQTCCGQPAFNNGDVQTARALAKKLINEVHSFQYIVAPSGSCIGMLRDFEELFYKDRLHKDKVWYKKALDIKSKSYEITSFLVDILRFKGLDSSIEGSITYHDSCTGLRKLNIKQQPRKLIKKNSKIELKEMIDSEECCGFGGTFCVKYSDISNEMLKDKIENIINTSADVIVAGEMGCLLNIVGKLKRQGSKTQARHVVELLLEEFSSPAIAEVEKVTMPENP